MVTFQDRIPRAMSTQHPDNSTPAPFAAEDGALRGEGEIAEAAHVFTEMGCDEQMWDYEGKGADVDVVLKLLQRNPEFFRTHPLGRDCRLTLRIPNPTEERELRKKMEEADRKSTRLNSSHVSESRMPSSA